MKTPENIASVALAHKNWTGLSLGDLLATGRMHSGNKSDIMGFIRAANGEAQSLDEVRAYRTACELIASGAAIAQ